MPPKSDKNQSNPEKHAKLIELWANNLPLKYDDHALLKEVKLFYLLNNYLSCRANWKCEEYGSSFRSAF